MSGLMQGIFLVLSAISPYIIETNLHKGSTTEKSDLSCGNNILDKIFNQLVFNF